MSRPTFTDPAEADEWNTVELQLKRAQTAHFLAQAEECRARAELFRTVAKNVAVKTLITSPESAP